MDAVCFIATLRDNSSFVCMGLRKGLNVCLRLHVHLQPHLHLHLYLYLCLRLRLRLCLCVFGRPIG